MKKFLLTALCASTGLISVANAATITFEDELQYPVTATAAGIQGLNRTKVSNGQTFDIEDVDQGVINTNVNMDVFKSPNVPYAPTGSVGWDHTGNGNRYNFTISAGGGWQKDGLVPYCVEVFVDGSLVGKNCSAPISYWEPTYEIANLRTSSSITVKLTPQ